MIRKSLFILSLSAVSACGGSDPPTPAQETLWHCDYVNSFTEQAECQEYRGAGWTEADARFECDDESGALAAGACANPATLGTCVVPERAGAEVHILFTGEDTSTCSTLNQVCETFASGDFVPTSACEGKTDDPVPPLEEPNTQLVCVEPRAGEPPGKSEGGKVCTWESLNGCTELGRNYADYVSCEPAYEARGYYPAPPAQEPAPDPRMQDPAYVAEVAWVKAQTEACSCVCCHQGSRTPAGAAIWDTEIDGNFLNSFSPWGLAFMAGFVDSSIFGYRPAEENNGFSRETTGMPTQDPERLLKFFTEELAHRGYTPEDFTK